MSECEDSSPILRDAEWNTRRTRRQGYEMIDQLDARGILAFPICVARAYFFMIRYLRAFPRVWSSFSKANDAAVSVDPGSC